MKKMTLATLAAAVVAGSLATVSTAGAQDAKAGAAKVEMCLGCHNIPGYQASFPEIYKVPKIAGQSAKYIVAALTAYQKGERKHPSMRGIATSLSQQDMADVAAFYEGLEKSAPPPAKAAEPPADIAPLLAKANCASCHGANFATPIDPTYPKIAGQYADYLYVALKAYQTDKNDRIGRSNAIMMGMARPFTHAELKQLAKYLSSLPSDLKTVPLHEFR
jgi:cytochrome c553